MAQVRADESIACFSAKAHPIHDFRSKTHVLGGFATFGCRKCTVAKSDPRMPFWHEFRPMKLFSRFSAKMHPIHSIWSKAHVLGGFAPFGSRKCTIAKSGPGMPFRHELGPMKLFLSFPDKTHPIHYFRSKTHVLGGFPPFGCRKCSVVKSGPRMPFWHEFGPTKLLSCFSAKAHPIHDFRSKTHVLGGFATFGCRKVHRCEIGS